jgi:hypothetical protein
MACQLAQLQRLRELLLQREPQLLDTFIDELALFQVGCTTSAAAPTRHGCLGRACCGIWQ